MTITAKIKGNVRCILMLFLLTGSIFSQDHPKLVLTKEGVANIKRNLGKMPLFDASLAQMKSTIDTEIATGIHMPIPKDYSGGYTHERHKKNFLAMQKAGLLFQIVADEKYAIYVRDMLMEYAEMYPNLPVHPKERSYARGKIFWQCLNDSNWLVYVSQAYDCVYDWLSKRERKKLEKDLFKPFADYISKGNPQFFNRVHNHSTWGNVAVGMIALVMDDDELLNRALYGLKTDAVKKGMKDNDGGFIQTEGQKLGFYANLDEPFSPDGYYTEGPYYQRYAMYPFLIFAQALHNVKPELKIFEYNDGVLLKSVDALLNLSDSDGDFFPINDAQKGMSYYSRELVTAVDIAYYYGGENPQLLDIAHKQNRVALNDTGIAVAIAIEAGKKEVFEKKSVELRDGADGTEGGIAILRNGKLELVFKYAAQGLSHGHYDKLSYSLYEDGNEIVQDYGLARFVNIEQKGGGNYLKENKTWAKQTIAHNTLVQDGQSHFKGKYELGSKHHSEKYFFDVSNPNVQVASAKEHNAYPGTAIHRTMAMIKDTTFANPFVLDIVRVRADTPHKYELPFYYMGQLMQVDFEYTSNASLEAMGEENGYQHLYQEGVGKVKEGNTTLNWLHYNKFYSNTSLTAENDEMIFGRIGANDPNFNLRRDPVYIHKKTNTKNTTFVSVIESHGTYSPVSEFAENAYSKVEKLVLVHDDDNYTGVKVFFEGGTIRIFILAHRDNTKLTYHNLKIGKETFSWQGPFYSN